MNNKSKHTPGPWVVKPIKDGFHDGKAFIFGPQLDKTEYRPAPVVALIDKPCKDKDEHAANLALISAAPELLAALENLVIWRDPSHPEHEQMHQGMSENMADNDQIPDSAAIEAELIEAARAAIAKAKGE